MDPLVIIRQLVSHLEAVCESAANWGAALEETEGDHNVANARVASARRYIEEVNASGILAAQQATRQPVMRVLTDDSFMPFGKWQGVPMKDVDAAYLHWLWSNETKPMKGREKTDPVAAYIHKNLAALIEEYPDGLGWE